MNNNQNIPSLKLAEKIVLPKVMNLDENGNYVVGEFSNFATPVQVVIKWVGTPAVYLRYARLADNTDDLVELEKLLDHDMLGLFGADTWFGAYLHVKVGNKIIARSWFAETTKEEKAKALESFGVGLLSHEGLDEWSKTMLIEDPIGQFKAEDMINHLITDSYDPDCPFCRGEKMLEFPGNKPGDKWWRGENPENTLTDADMDAMHDMVDKMDAEGEQS